MANPKPIVIDGEIKTVSADSKISDLAPEASSVITSDGRLLSGKQLQQAPLPDGFSSVHSGVEKGGL